MALDHAALLDVLDTLKAGDAGGATCPKARWPPLTTIPAKNQALPSTALMTA
jgi:hypothetical protein